jgi:hypothetical protein
VRAACRKMTAGIYSAAGKLRRYPQMSDDRRGLSCLEAYARWPPMRFPQIPPATLARAGCRTSRTTAPRGGKFLGSKSFSRMARRGPASISHSGLRLSCYVHAAIDPRAAMERVGNPVLGAIAAEVADRQTRVVESA